MNRYQRSERALSTVNIDVQQMYDKEIRGARLLERSRLSHEHQRQILIGTMQSLDIDVVKEVMMFQWPDHRPLPPALGGGDQRQGHSQHRYRGKGDGKGKSKDKNRHDQPRRALVAENVDDANADNINDYEENHSQPADHDADGADYANEMDGDDQNGNDDEDYDQPSAEDDGDDLSKEISQILTITAKKLSSVVQARKFGNPPAARKSIADRKRVTHCAACGAQGHWQGDPECTASANKKGSGKGGPKGSSSKSKPDDRPPQRPPKSVHFLSHHYYDEEEDEPEPQHLSHQVLVADTINQVLLTDATKAAGFIILDTACQRMCAGQQWVQAHQSKLKQWGIHTFQIQQREFFEFDKGPTQRSEHAECFPASFGGQLCVLAPCILNANIPCLASQTWMTEVGTVIDLAERFVKFTKLNVHVPLCMVNGHIKLLMPLSLT